MLRALHQDRQRDARHNAYRQGDVSDRIPPGPLLSVDGAKREPSDGQRDDCRPEPVEVGRGLLVPAFGDVVPGGPRGDDDQRHVDEEGGAPRDRVDEQASDDRTEDRRGARGPGPNSERAALLLAREVCGQQSERAGDQHRARRALQDPKQNQELHRGGKPAQDGCQAETDEAIEKHAAPAVEVGQRAREDQQGAQREQVCVVDVRLSFQDSEEGARQVAADAREGDVDDRRVKEDDP